MNPDDLIHAAPEVRNIVAIIVGGVPVADIVKSILLPSAAVLGKRMADRVERMFEKTGKMVQDAGITPQSVSDKLIVEIVRGASLEDNENLHTMWAALLANAASPDGTGKVRPGFIAILRQMAPDEAAMLNWIFGQRTGQWTAPFNDPIPYMDLMNAYTNVGIPAKDDPFGFDACIQGLRAAQLIEPRLDTHNPLGVLKPPYSLTFRGLSFMFACRAPAPKPTT